MNKFAAISIFTRVAEQGSFTAAARTLGVSVSAVTKAISRLEDDLGVQLFARSTRQIHITDYGLSFLERCTNILAELEEAETELQLGTGMSKGRVRVVVPFSFGRVTLVPDLPMFFERYPDIELELNFSDRPVDMISEGYDVAVRTGDITDSRLTVRVLNRSPEVTAASPSYIAKYGRPSAPEDLMHHNCIVGRFGPEWEFRRPNNGGRFNVRVSGNATINNGDALREAAVAGLGIIQGTWWLLRKDLQRGSVEALMPEYAIEGTPISILYAANRHLPLKVRSVIDFIVEISRC